MEVGYGILIMFITASVIYSTEIISYDCFNPNNKLGVCISLYACPTVLRLFLNSPASPDNGTFLQQSYCKNGFGAPPFVCCTNDFSLKPEDGCSLKHQPKPNLRATPEECTGDDRLSLAFFNDYGCIGSLINHRYILTTAECARGAEHQTVFIGKSKTIFAILAGIPHEAYNDTQMNNIGLMRLSQSIQFSTEIAPSCLPSAVNGFEGHKVGNIITLSDYYTYDDVNHTAEIVENCSDIKFFENQIYAKINATKLVLRGIPLAVQFNGAQVIEGMHSGIFSYTNCIPYIRVSEYEDWILSKMEP